MINFFIWLICAGWIFSDLRLRVKKPIAIASSLILIGILGWLGNWIGSLFGFDKSTLIFSSVSMIFGAMAGREISKSLRRRLGN